MTRLSALLTHGASPGAEQQPTILVLGSSILRSRLEADWRASGWKVMPHGEFPLPPPGPGSAKALAKLFKSQKLPTVIHPGDDAWAYRPELLAQAEAQGIRVVSPPARTLQMFSNRLHLLERASKEGVPHLLLSNAPMHRFSEVKELLAPKGEQTALVLRSVVPLNGAQEDRVFLPHAGIKNDFDLWKEHLQLQSGEAMFFAERRLDGARKIAAPFVRGARGEILHLPSIDLSIQSGGRPWLSTCPAAAMGCENQIQRWVEKLAHAWSYHGYGEFHFMVDGRSAFLVGGMPHWTRWAPLWEQVLGVSHVELFESVYGLRRSGAGSSFSGKSQFGNGTIPSGFRMLRPAADRACLAVFAYAEHVGCEIPTPGTFEMLSRMAPERGSRPLGADWKWEVFSEKGRLRWSDDTWMGVLWIQAKRFKLAFEVATDRLRSFEWNGTLRANISFLVELLEHPWLREGVYHAGFVDEEFIPYSQVKPGLTSREGARSERMYALAEGRVHSVFLRAGRKANAHESLMWLESGKRIVDHRLPVATRVIKWLVKAGDIVERGQEIAILEPI